MKTMKSILRMSAALILVWSCQAGAIPFVSEGIWTGLEQGDGVVDNIDGVGTNEVTWGDPFPDENVGPSSGYTFDGVPMGDAPLNADLFALGVFTHANFTIFLPSITGADLTVDLTFTDGGGPVAQAFDFFFEHTETPNNASPCAEGGGTPCRDKVSLPDAASTETVTLDGILYQLEIIGFSQDDGASVTPEFFTLEEQNNSATLFARLVEVNVPVSAPPTVALAAVALIGLWASSLRRRRSRVAPRGGVAG